MRIKFTLEVNNRIEIILEDNVYKSVIQEIGEDCFYIAVPMEKGQYKKFVKGQKLTMYNYVETNMLFKFQCKVLGMDKCGNMPLYKLSMPENAHKIQRREFVRVDITKKISYLKSGQTAPQSAVLVDLSGGGMRMKTKEKLELNEIITLNLDEDIAVEGKVVWANKFIDYYDYGISYCNINDKTREKIIRKIFTIMRKQRELI